MFSSKVCDFKENLKDGIFLPKIGEITFDPKPVSHSSAFSPKPKLRIRLKLRLINNKYLKLKIGKSKRV